MKLNNISSSLRCLFVFAVCLVLSLFSHSCSNARIDEFGGHPDEPSHVVTGLMIRDYLLHAPGSSPMAFAENYYLHYPKVALGHWPPLFYGLQAAWTLVFPASRTGLLLLMACMTALLSTMLVNALSRELPFEISLAAGLLFIAVPLVRNYTAMIMSDMPSALLCFAAALIYSKFLQSGRARYSLAFGAIAALAILNKGSGFQLALIPPLALLFAKRLSWLKRPSFWLPAVVVALLCAPWYALTFRMMANGFEKPQGLAGSLAALRFYFPQLINIIGPGFFILAVFGIVFILFAERHHIQSILRMTPVAALFVVNPLFHCLITNADDSRYLLPAAAPCIMLGIFGADTLARWLSARSLLQYRHIFTALFILGVGLFTAFSMRPAQAPSYGFAPVVEHILKNNQNAPVVCLVSSDAIGEGMVIAQTAMRHPEPAPYIARAGKLLADSDWAGTQYEPRFDSPDKTAKFLEETPISFILLDSSFPSNREQQHHRFLKQAVTEHPEQWVKVRAWDVVRRGTRHPLAAELYMAAKPRSILGFSIQADLKRMLGRTLSAPALQ